MNALLMAAGSAMAAWSGMAVLCFQSASQRRRLGLHAHSAGEKWRFTMAATALIGMSLAAAVAADGVQFGLILWLCQAGLLGLGLICCLPFARAAVTASAWAAGLLSPPLLAAASAL
jgi:hypothetical protein